MSAKYKILIVDDEDDVEQLVRQRFRRQVRELEYEFVFAKNGLEALEQLEKNADVDAIFSDINMPQMDGLTLLEKVATQNPLVKTVIISAYGDMKNIRVAMNRGAFDFICKPFDFEDFEQTLLKTLGSVEAVKKTLEAVRENNILKMYVDGGVLQFMTSQTFADALQATETIDASIVFVDICGFTAISEREPPEVVIRLLNKIFDQIAQEIIASGGYVDKFIGDAVLAVFRGDGHLERAIRAAKNIHERLVSTEEKLTAPEPFSPRVSIGINSGEVISGNVGSLALSRFDFTVIGDVVNTAQRLQSAAAAGQTLINERTREKLGAAFSVEKIGEMTLKNKAKSETIFEVDAGRI